MKIRVPNAVIITEQRGRTHIYTGKELEENKARALGNVLRNIMTVIKVYCQTGTPLSSSGGSVQVSLLDSQLYLGRIRSTMDSSVVGMVRTN